MNNATETGAALIGQGAAGALEVASLLGFSIVGITAALIMVLLFLESD